MPSGYDLEQHVVSVRLRITGSGSFQSRLAALEDNPQQTLTNITMQSNANRPVSLLANIRSTRIQYHGWTDSEDEYFVIKNITLFAKPIATGYPQ